MNFFNRNEFIQHIINNNIQSVEAMLNDGIKKGFNIPVEIEYNRDDGLRIASTHGRIALVELLLQRGKKTQERYNTALRTASMFNQLELVKHLIEDMENVIDIKKECLFALKINGEYGNLECIEYLISKDMDHNILQDISNKKTKDWLFDYNQKLLFHDNLSTNLKNKILTTNRIKL